MAASSIELRAAPQRAQNLNVNLSIKEQSSISSVTVYITPFWRSRQGL